MIEINTKEKYVEKILAQVGAWLPTLNNRYLYDILGKLYTDYRNSYINITPDENLVFKCFELCDYDSVKVVMIGQDPYPQYKVATGIMFGNNDSTLENDLSPSLNVIKNTILNFKNKNNSSIFDKTLESWCRQGILMLNSALTTEINETGSHIMLWRPFMTELLIALSNDKSDIIYVLFGEQAKTLRPYIKNKDLILIERHPAYYARINQEMPPMIFDKINLILESQSKEKIEWI